MQLASSSLDLALDMYELLHARFARRVHLTQARQLGLTLGKHACEIVRVHSRAVLRGLSPRTALRAAAA
eukprot:791463-Pleurochrysis_carterae.AAC.3